MMQTFVDQTMAEMRASGVEIGGKITPWIMREHIDGPLLHFSDAQLHWLTLWERFLLWRRWTDAERLQRKLRPRLTAEQDQLKRLAELGAKRGWRSQ
jgi:hypothetical protein